MKRVLYVGRFDVPGLLARSRAALSPSNHVHALPDLERLGFEVTGLDMGAAGEASAWDAQRRVLRVGNDFDAIVAHGHYDVRGLALLRRMGRLRPALCAFVHTHAVQVWHRAYLPGYDVLWPVGARGQAQLLANGAHSDKVILFPYGADLRYYREPLPWRQDTPIVLSVGVSGRDFATLVDAAAQINAPVHVVGRVAPEDVRRAPANMTFHSHGDYDLSFDDLLALYARAACVAVVHHGTEHPYGNTALVEAMALGRPVVGTRSLGLDLDAGRLGFGRSVAPHDAAALAEAVNGMLVDVAGARAMGARGRALVEQQYNAQRNAELMARNLEHVLARPGRVALA